MATYRGRLVSFSSGSYVASVRLDGSPAQAMEGVPVSRGLPAAEMVAGRRVLLDTGDHNHPGDAVVTAVW